MEFVKLVRRKLQVWRIQDMDEKTKSRVAAETVVQIVVFLANF